MPKPKRKKTNVVAEAVAGSKTTGGGPGGRQTGRRTFIFVTAVIIVLVLITGGIVFYQSRFAPLQQPVITVDKTVIRMDYFLNRTKMSGSSPVSMLQQLVDEQIVKLMAPAYGITVTPQEIDSALLTTASTGNTTGNLSDNSTGRYLTESEFKAWYQQQLDRSGLSDAEYRDMAGITLLGRKLQDDLSRNIVSNVTQIHLNVIVLANSADAAKARARIQAGENFTAVAGEVSLDTQSRDQGGDIGWIPPGVLPYDDTTFALGVGEVSNALAVNPETPDTSQYLLFMVSEKAAAREIDEGSMQVLRNRALANWLLQEEPSHSIIVNYDFNNTANQAWIDWQLSKVNR